MAPAIGAVRLSIPCGPHVRFRHPMLPLLEGFDNFRDEIGASSGSAPIGVRGHRFSWIILRSGATAGYDGLGFRRAPASSISMRPSAGATSPPFEA
ncbi:MULTISPECIES: hypothetical protein [unclassified Methylobacterium]|uniref:hypothetical protein n=1 Tax=unclassified Methylobacterium TaxID=2615210 RepID=UPI002269BA0F|nr:MULTISPECIES: hypothetical protein [unclassified Methylobacterium]